MRAGHTWETKNKESEGNETKEKDGGQIMQSLVVHGEDFRLYFKCNGKVLEVLGRGVIVRDKYLSYSAMQMN